MTANVIPAATTQNITELSPPISEWTPGAAVADSTLFGGNQSAEDVSLTAVQVATYLSALQVFVVKTIDTLTTGQTTLVPAKTGKRFVVTAALLELAAVTGTGTPGTIRIGNNVTFNNVVAAQSLAALTVATTLFPLTTAVGLTSINVTSAAIKLDVSIATLGYDAYTINAYVTGFYYA